MTSGRLLSIIIFIIIFAAIIPGVPTTKTVINDPDFPEARCVVNQVIDGDTFRCAPSVNNGTYIEAKIRLADVNAPELDTPEGVEAKKALEELILGKIVYLDVDDKYGTDIYGRWVAVAYIRYNDTSILNVNKWLVDNGYATISDYDNEFDPSQFELYETYPISSDRFPSNTTSCITSSSPLYPEWSPYASRYGTLVGYVSSLSPNYYLHVLVNDPSDGFIRNETFMDTDVYHGLVRSAANESGLLVAWNQYNYTIGGTTYSRITLYRYVPFDPGETATSPRYLYTANYEYAPLVGYGTDSSGSPVWLITYVRSTTTNVRLYYYVLGKDLGTIDWGYTDLTPSGVYYADKPDVGVDYIGGIHFANNAFYIVARNYTSSTGYDMVMIKIYEPSPGNWVAEQFPLDVDTGDQGPVSEQGAYGYRLYTLTKNIDSSVWHSPNGDRIIVVYNVSSSILRVAVYDTQNDNVVLSYDISITISTDDSHPRMDCSSSSCLAVFTDGSGIYGSIVRTDLSYNSSFEFIELNAVNAYPIFNGENYTVVFTVTNGSEKDIYMAVVDDYGYNNNYTVPVAVYLSTNETLLIPVIIGDTLSVYYQRFGDDIYLVEITPVYTEPAPIPENYYMWLAAIASIAVVLIAVYWRFSRRTR